LLYDSTEPEVPFPKQLTGFNQERADRDDPFGLASFPYRLVQLSQRCYAFVDDEGMANVGVIKVARGIVLIDATIHPYYFDQLARIATECLQAPICYLIYTHFHRDHTGGCSSDSFIPLQIVAHRKTLDYLTQVGAAHFRDGGLASANLKIRLPTITFETQTFCLPDAPEVSLANLGGHTHDSCAIVVAEDNIIFAGDLLFTNSAPYLSFWSCLDGYGQVLCWISALRELLNHSPSWILPGHGPVSRKQDVQSLLALFEHYAALVTRAVERGLSLRETWRDVIRRRDFVANSLDPELYLHLIMALHRECCQQRIGNDGAGNGANYCG
jgi:cyclase